MNRRIYAGADQLTDEQRREDVGLFWKSLQRHAVPFVVGGPAMDVAAGWLAAQHHS